MNKRKRLPFRGSLFYIVDRPVLFLGPEVNATVDVE